MSNFSQIEELLRIMRCLRDPQKGCPWDLQQNFHTIAPYTVEEAYEVADAIEREDMQDLKEELGDLLFQVVFHAQMAQEQGWFEFDDVVIAINEKMVRRHPHVFADTKIESAEQQTAAWEQLKHKEREEKPEHHSTLDGVAKSLPGLTRALKLQRRAAKVGFDWLALPPVFEKLNEEVEELKAELQTNAAFERKEDELGDILFTAVNIARHAGIDPELALRRANLKFETRFRKMESLLEQDGKSIDEIGAQEMDHLWEQIKNHHR